MARQGLTPKQEAFVREYLRNGRNASAAYRAAYGGNPSAQRAAEEGARLLNHPKVAPRVARVVGRAVAATDATAERVLKELARVAFLDPRRVFTWGPDGVKIRESSELTEDEAACVAEASQTVTEAGGTIRLKLADKLAALEKLGRHLGLWKDDAAPPPAEVVVRVYGPGVGLANLHGGRVLNGHGDGNPTPN